MYVGRLWPDLKLKFTQEPGRVAAQVVPHPRVAPEVHVETVVTGSVGGRVRGPVQEGGGVGVEEVPVTHWRHVRGAQEDVVAVHPEWQKNAKKIDIKKSQKLSFSPKIVIGNFWEKMIIFGNLKKYIGFY